MRGLGFAPALAHVSQSPHIAVWTDGLSPPARRVLRLIVARIPERVFFIDNILVRIHLIIEIIRLSGDGGSRITAACAQGVPLLSSLRSSYTGLYSQKFYTLSPSTVERMWHI